LLIAGEIKNNPALLQMSSISQMNFLYSESHAAQKHELETLNVEKGLVTALSLNL
jgi:hypothetical protein